MRTEQTENLLNAIYKNVRMGSYAIDCIIEEIEDKELEKLIRRQNKKYLSLTNDCTELSRIYHIELKDISMMLKASSFTSIKMKTMTNNKVNHLSEMLIQGTTMGITNVLKEIGNNQDAEEKVKRLASDLQRAEEEFVDSLKTFLTK